MLPAHAASAAAARAIGYAGPGDLIEADGLGPEQLAALLRLSCSKRAAREYVIIILAGAIARHRAAPKGWDGRLERELALKALEGEPDHEAAFLKLCEQANRLV